MPCCALNFGTLPQANCLLASPITQNNLAYPYLPLTNPPNPNKKRMFHVRIYSQPAYTNAIEFIVYVSPPLVNGAFPSTPVLHTQFALTGNWISSGGRMYKQGIFTFTPTQAQVTNGVCFLVKASPMGIAECAIPSGFTNLGVQPLAAIFDRPW